MRFWFYFSAALVASPLAAADSNESKRLLKNLESGDASAQMQAQAELRTWRFKDVVEMVANFGDGTNPDVRILMAQVLGELGGAEAARHLQKLYFKEKVDKVRRAILIQLTGIIPTYEESFGFYEQAALKDKNPEIRFLALSQLSLFARAEGFSEALASAAKRAFRRDPDPKNQVLSALILVDLGEQSSGHEEFLSRAFSDPDASVRLERVGILAQFNSPDCRARLENLARSDPSPEVREAARKIMGKSVLE